MTHQPPASHSHAFVDRHLGVSDDADRRRMLDAIGVADLDALIDAAVPAAIRTDRPLDLPASRTEPELLAELRAIADRNTVRTSMIGQGFFGTITPPVIQRNVLENPAWYTAYTPYQPEISQGRLEALLDFQTMVSDLTGLPIANASMLDESSAAAEAVLLMRRANKQVPGGVIAVDTNLYPQHLAVIRGRAEAAGIELVVADLAAGLPEGDLTGIVLQQPGDDGVVTDHAPIIAAAKARGAMVTVIADLLALALIVPPGEQDADIAVGSTQRFGVPLFFGGPHAAFFAVRAGLERALPGRLVGVSKDQQGRTALRLALQTREQHIRRDRATSNICTAQALLAVMAAMYAVYHGPDGIRAIAERVHDHARSLAGRLAAAGVELVADAVFDTVRARVPGRADAVVAAAADAGINLRRVDGDHVSISVDETTTAAHLERVIAAFGEAGDAAGESTAGRAVTGDAAGAADGASSTADAEGAWDDQGGADDRGTANASIEADGLGRIPEHLRRTSAYLTHPHFTTVRSETQMLRLLRRLADRDLALDRTMIPLGSCTMKLNATTELLPITWPEFAAIHPYAPDDQTVGWRQLIAGLEQQLAEITGYTAVSVQPNAGSQGEYAGLLAIRSYLRSRGDDDRDICLIPASAHGTNAASAVLAGLRVVVVGTTETGAVDLDDLDAKLAEHGDRLAAIMLTYPSTYGIFDAEVRTVCERVHAAGGQVYIDGANMNALVGLARLGELGGDVSHLNLHKTFAIPHGGGGPGVGPVAVAEHLVPFLPGDPLAGQSEAAGCADADGASAPGDDSDSAAAGAAPVTATRFGSAGVLPISYAYLALLGPDGLRRATESAILAANYLAARLREHYPILFAGADGFVAHECILDLRPLTKRTGVTAEDVAKRLIDYGFHAPTLAFPVAGTLMVEPTESEDLDELDRFVEAMASIRAEIDAIADGAQSVEESPLRNAPHPAAVVTADEWTRPYSREQAAYPVPRLRETKYWPPVSRIDGAWGDRNLVCECPPIESYAEGAER